MQSDRPVQFETISCPVCGSTEYHKERDVRDRFNTIPGQTYTIVRCDQCQLLYLNPRPDNASLGVFYSAEGYDPFVSSRDNANLLTGLYRFVRRFTIRRKAARVSGELKRNALCLDVGCATGEFLVELRRRGFQVRGVEPDPRSAEFSRMTHGLQVWTGTIHDVPDDAGPFDLITLWHVLEHVPDLPQNLLRLHGLLKTGGRLAIAVPNPCSGDARHYQANWVAWDTPRHLYHFEPPVMLKLLEQSGFEARRAGAVAFDAFYHSLLSESGGFVRFWGAGWQGLLSFVRGIYGGEGSSELYIAHKR